MSSMVFRTEHKQTQALSPRLQHAVRLLQMSSLDFAALVRDAAGSNPFLEPDGSDEGDGGDSPSVESNLIETTNDFHNSLSGDALGTEPCPVEHADFAERDGEPDGYGDDRDIWLSDGGGPGSGTGNGSGSGNDRDDSISALDLLALEVPLTQHLHGQLKLMPLPARDLALAQALVESLDDDGYLRSSLEDLLDLPGLAPSPTLTELKIALSHVQALEPAGVGARSVAECLQLQLPGIECTETRALARVICEHHLNELAARDVNGLARKMGQTPTRIEAVCDRIRRLDPRPGWRFGNSHAAYVVPDVIVRKVGKHWDVQLNPAILPRVQLNKVYAQMFQCHRTPANAELGAQLNEARWTLRNVKQRFSTILDVAQAIVRRQHQFLAYGAMAMKPLGLREIAEEVGVHESTVSRVTNNKYIAAPSGVFELKYFFSRSMLTTSGRACSGTAIRGLIKDMIETERHDLPLSDAEIARQLAQQGLEVARRTVTKYRQLLKIDAVERRRRHS